VSENRFIADGADGFNFLHFQFATPDTIEHIVLAYCCWCCICVR